MPTIASLAGPIEARMLRTALPWSAVTGTLGVGRAMDETAFARMVGAAIDATPPWRTLGAVVDDHAAVFGVIGDGPAGARTLEPLTYLARAVDQDPATMTRIRAVLASVDDLGTPFDLRRVAFSTTDEATAALGLLSDARPLAPSPHALELGDALAYAAASSSQPYASHTGFYQYGRGELVYSPRASARLLHAAFADPTSPLRPLSAAEAGRIGVHELVHALQPPSARPSPALAQARFGASEATASVVGTLRSGTLLRSLGDEVTDLAHATMPSTYDPYTATTSALVRLGGRSLDDPRAIAALERQLVSTDPLRLLDDLARDAGARTGVATHDLRNAAVAAFDARDAQRFASRAADAGVRDADTSVEWMFTEARRRAAVTA